MISFIRIDSRLIHGQVIETWLPHLKIQRIVVADDLAFSDPLVRTAMGLAVPSEVEVLLSRVDDVPYRKLENDGVRTIVQDIQNAETKRAYAATHMLRILSRFMIGDTIVLFGCIASLILLPWSVKAVVAEPEAAK